MIKEKLQTKSLQLVQSILNISSFWTKPLNSKSSEAALARVGHTVCQAIESSL